MARSIPGTRPDKARVVCGNCGHVFEPRGNPCNVAPNQRVRAKCPDCPVNGVVYHNQYGYISGTTGEIRIDERE